MLLIPKNSAIRFLAHFVPYYGENLKIDICSKTKLIYGHSKLVPEITYRTQSHLGGFQQPGLICQRNQLHFVSCREDQIRWLNKLKELVTVSDLPPGYFYYLCVFC